MALDVSGSIILRDEFSQTVGKLQTGAKSADQALSGLDSTVKRLETDLGKAGAADWLPRADLGLDADFDRVGASLKGAAVEAAQLKAGMTEAGAAGKASAQSLAAGFNVVRGSLAAVVALKLGEVAFDLAEIGARAETVDSIFQNLTRTYGVNGAALLTNLRQASRGTMDALALTQVANRALLAGGASLAKDLPQLFEIARAAALASGDDIGRVFETLVTGIVRASPMLIDNAGIFLKIGDAVEAYAEKLGKSADELTAFEKQEAVKNAVLKDGLRFMEATGTGAETAADQVQSLTTSVTDLKAALGELLATAGAPQVFAWLADGAKWLTALLNVEGGSSAQQLAGLQEQLRQLEATRAGMADKPMGKLLLAGTDKEIAELRNRIAELTAAEQDALEQFGAVGPGAAEAADGVQTLEQAVAKLRRETAAPITVDISVAGLQGALDDIDALALRLVGSLDPGQIRKFRDRARADVETHWRAMGATDKFGMEVASAQLVGGWDKIVDGVLSSQKRMVSGTKTNLTTIAASAGELRGKVENALKMGLEVTPDDFLQVKAGTYEPKALEAARRLQAVAERGFAELQVHPDWAAALEIPPDVLSGSEEQLKAWASRTKADVVDLARPDLIDWDAFIANFKSGLDREAAQKLTVDIAVEKLDAAGLLKGSAEARRKEVAKALGVAAPELTIDALFKTQEGAAGALLTDLLGPEQVLTVPAKVEWQTLGLFPGSQPMTKAGEVPAPMTKAPGADTAGPQVPFMPMILQDLSNMPAPDMTEVAQKIGGGLELALAGLGIGPQFASDLSGQFAQSKPLFSAAGVQVGADIARALHDALLLNLGTIRGDIAGLVAPEVAVILNRKTGAKP